MRKETQDSHFSSQTDYDYVINSAMHSIVFVFWVVVGSFWLRFAFKLTESPGKWSLVLGLILNSLFPFRWTAACQWDMRSWLTFYRIFIERKLNSLKQSGRIRDPCNKQIGLQQRMHWQKRTCWMKLLNQPRGTSVWDIRSQRSPNKRNCAHNPVFVLNPPITLLLIPWESNMNIYLNSLLNPSQMFGWLIVD